MSWVRVIRQDDGEILLDGKKLSVDSPSHSQSLGIYFIHQEPKLFLNRSVLSNIFINQFPNNGVSFVPFSKIKQEANRILNSLVLVI
jgi:ABC-type sugar transport system ATPase subunit